MALAFGGILCVFVVLFSIFFAGQLQGDHRSAAWFSILFLIGCIALFGFAFRAATKKHIGMATAGTLLATDVTIIWFLFFWSVILGHQGDSITLLQFVSLSLAIMLAGAIGNTRLVIATTILMNGVTLTLGLAFYASNLGLLFVIGILQQWTAATLAIVIVSSYQQTLRELSQAYAQTRQLDELKERFITNVNHELRTPVMTVLGYIDYLQRTWQALPPEHLMRGFQKAREVGEQLMRLIESILDVRRIDETIVENPEPVALRAVCAQALQLVDPREAHLEGRAIPIDIPEGLAVWGETTRVQQVLTNLISNAGKYSPPGTPIEVAAQALPAASSKDKSRRKKDEAMPEQAMVEIRVRDYGFGIPPEQLPLLFNRFVRLPRDLASTITGNGLGLYLCRTLVTAMRGQIWAESSGVAGEGSTFIIRLPLCTFNPV